MNTNMQQLETLTNKHYLSLAAIMLLAHAVPLALKNSEVVLQEDEKEFINSYIDLGKILVYILAWSGVFRLLYQQLWYKRLTYVSTAANSIILLTICLSIYTILYDTIIYRNKKIDIQTIKTLFKTHLFAWKK